MEVVQASLNLLEAQERVLVGDTQGGGHQHPEATVIRHRSRKMFTFSAEG